MHRVGHCIALGAIVVVAVLLRYQRIGADAVSLDEMWHLELSTGRGSPQLVSPADVVLRDVSSWTEIAGAPPWYKCWTGMERVLHPPLFVMTLRLWRDVFGSGDIAAQWYTAVWSLLAIVVLFDIVRVLSRSAAAGLWTAAILAVSPTQILLSQEVRAYTMLMGLACCAMSAVARIERLGLNRRRVIALGVAMLAMMLTHYFAIALCVAIAVWAHLRLRGRQLGAMWIAFASAGFVYAIIWLPIAIRQIPDISATADPWLKEQVSNAAGLAVGRFFTMPIRLMVDQDYAGFAWPLIGFAFLVTAAMKLRRRRELLAPLLWFAGVCGFLLLLDLARTTRHLVYIRYSLPAAPAVAALAVMMWQSRKNAARAANEKARLGVGPHVAGAIIVSLLLWQNRAAYFADEPDFRVLRNFMVNRAAAGEPMLFYSGPAVKGYFNEILMLAASREPKLFPRDFVKMSKPATPELLRSLNSPTAWLFAGPVRDEDMPVLLPGCTVLEQQLLVDADKRSIAVCTHVALPK